jgi:hypothetical protein
MFNLSYSLFAVNVKPIKYSANFCLFPVPAQDPPQGARRRQRPEPGAAAAYPDCSCGVQGSGVYLLRRSDECPGRQQRERDHGALAPVLPGPHGCRGGAPVEHGQGCGQHRRPGQRPRSRRGDARGADGETRNILRISEEPVGVRQLDDGY